MRAFWAAAGQQPMLPFLIAGAMWGIAALALTAWVFDRRIGKRP
jgi:hypothetical protein